MTPEDIKAARENLNVANTAVRKAMWEWIETVICAYDEGMSYAAIGRAAGLSRNAIYVTIARHHKSLVRTREAFLERRRAGASKRYPSA